MTRFFLAIPLLIMAGYASSETSKLQLTGPYLGQTPPGEIPVIFAPGYVASKHRDYSGFFSPDMTEFYFTRRDNDSGKWSLISYKKISNVWHERHMGPRVWRPLIAPDGKTMHLGRFYIERDGAGWSEVKSIGPLIDREEWGIMRLTSSFKGTYVFDDYKGGDVLRISRLENGKRLPPVKLGPQINSGKYTAHPFLAPDESYLIWDSQRPEGKGESDLYISFQQQDGRWSKAVSLGNEINTAAHEAGAYVTPDNQFLFFNRHTENGSGDIYWVKADVIQRLKLSMGIE